MDASADAPRSDRLPMRVFALSASRRVESLNSRLLALAVEALVADDVEVEVANIRDFDLPNFDGDLQEAEGVPEAAQRLARHIEESDGFVIASPEYNASMPGVLKNALDWVSRLRPQPFASTHCMLLSASPSMSGGNRGLWALRIPLEHLGTRVHPDMFSLAQARTAFSDDGQLTNPELAERLRKVMFDWADLIEAAKHYPCAKARWVEFLGERPEPAVDRVQ